MPTDRVELLTIGTELLLGFTLDSNSAFLGRTLSAEGVRIVRRTSVGDSPAAIRSAVDEALTRTGFVITTGGLGPTRDDMSKNVVAELLGMPLEFNDVVWEAVLARYRKFGRTPVESNRSQAMVPAGGVALPNQWGTAPGLWLESPRGTVVMLPGVPLEMRMLTEHEVVPRLRLQGGGSVIRSGTLRTCGIPESTLAERIGDLEDALLPLSLAYLPSTVGVDLRLTAWDMSADVADSRLRDGIALLRERASEWAYGEGDADLAEVVLQQLRATGRKLAVVESCTGGMLGGRITNIPGASDVFLGGYVTYANSAKEKLGVPAAMIARHGAVSSEVAAAMAECAANVSGASVAVAITGIAGPDGGSIEKPVGTVWFGFSVDGAIETGKSVFGGSRVEVRERAVQGALLGLWRHLRVAAAALMVVVAASCSSAVDLSVRVPGTVMLKVGEGASIAGTPWTVRFDSVVSDSRCPLGVFCIQAGEALMALHLDNPAADPPRRDNPYFNLGAAPITVEGYRFTQSGVEPIRRLNETIDPKSYVLTLLIESGTP